MNILPKDFQETAVNDLVKKLRRAAREAREGELQAVSLAAPTASGKTVMLIAAIERLFAGDDDAPPDPHATVLWITDQPELNLQTRDKMLAFSTVLTPATLRVIESDFDQERLQGNHVYFLNTQKLGKHSSFVTTGDKRHFTLWDTVATSVRERPGSVFVVIDEAHRGMAQSARDRNEANSIIQKFILGSEELPPVPIIVGISATPQRFTDLLAAAQRTARTRTQRAVTIEAAEVRSSGLIKDAIQFVHPTERQPSDMTLLREAVRAWQTYTRHWEAYGRSQELDPVRPLLAVQVTDASGTAVSQTNLAQALSVIEGEVGPLPDQALAHAFQDRGDLEVAGRRLRYLAPSEIHTDLDARVVFFKTSLTTGWDCPRAEVMMSFRTAADATYIAQLVGRMVRTPLADRIDADEHLNTVALFLPHYDAAGLTEVVKKLTDPESGLVPPTEVRTTPVTLCSRAAGSEALFAALEALPHYSVPRLPSPNETRRLLKLARRLSMDGLFADAPDKARELCLKVINIACRRVQDTPAFKAIVEERDTLDVRLVSYLYGEELTDEGEARTIAVSPENIADLFDVAGRKIGEGLYKEWWRRRVESGTDPRRAKLEFVALATPDLKRELDAAAKEQCKTWHVLYREKVRALPDAKRHAYEEIQGLAADPELVPLVFPEVIEAKLEGPMWPKHLYVDSQGQYPAALNEWERPVLKEELNREDLVGWLRVVPRKPWALTIPYQAGGAAGRAKPVFVDFLVVRQGTDGLVVDIIDPHNPNLGDAADKLTGLAQFAEAHGAQFGRIESIVLDTGSIRRLNLQDRAIQQKAKQVRSSTDVQRLFNACAVSSPTG